MTLGHSRRDESIRSDDRFSLRKNAPRLPAPVALAIFGQVLKSVLRVVVLLAVFGVVANSAEAQQRQRRTAQAAQTQSGDVWETPTVGLEYRIDKRWSFHLEGQLRFDQGMSRLRSLQVRPGLEYALTPNWALAAGYVQNTRYLRGARQSRGPFQDILYRTRIDGLPVAGRLRWEELFYDDNTVLVRTRALAGVRIPLGKSPWELALSNEVYINLTIERPGQPAGFADNHAFVGFGRQLTAWSKASFGYELVTSRERNGFRNNHNIKLNVIFNLN